MKRVYLDQNKWIDLAACNKGLERYARFRDVLIMAEAAAERGLASFPLSNVHYVETSHRRDWATRRDLALTMGRISRFHTMAPRRVLLPPEIDRALFCHFGLPDFPRRTQAFGIGVNHALGLKVLDYEVPEKLSLDPVTRLEVKRWVNDVEEWVSLSGLPPEAEKGIANYQPMKHQEVVEELAAGAERMRLRRRAAGWHRGDRGRRVAKANGYADNLEELNEAFERAGIPAGHLMVQGRDAMTAFIDSIPLVDVTQELWRQREAAVHKRWTGNDMNDVDALSRAVVYCDVVVTERQWTDLIKRGQLDGKYDTVVISDLSELTLHLV
jgi:hypothetical protein